MTRHIPVLLHEVLEGLSIDPGDVVCDATLGGGGYALAIAKKAGESGTLIGIDQDADAVRRAEERLAGTLCTTHLFTGNFKDIDIFVQKAGQSYINACVYDLGLSSFQLEESGRGFSFQKDEPLAMTFKKKPGEGDLTAAHILNTWNETSLANMLYGYGEERRARKIARALVAARKKTPFATTGQLVHVVEQTVPRRGKTHPATKTFQALRIAVNDELGALETSLEKVQALLAEEGRIAVVSFHSLEDRIVKKTFKAWEKAGYGKFSQSKPIVPTEEEQQANPRSRSAKLRIFIKHP